MNNTIITSDNGDFIVDKSAPSSALLEAGKPRLSADDKEAKKLFSSVQLAYDNLLISRVSSSAPSTELDKYAKAFEEYDDLVDIVVEATNGVAPAYYTDPMTCDTLESRGYNTKSMTYNEMAEVIGGIGFGN
tara:strand:+ start:4231 stop:4626 length:396 start_codon:yes stop_codon:yes gene_type:complete